eukprot:scaffold1516_cov230-Pinguiococcus_pyrenoidosus.AAC.9
MIFCPRHSLKQTCKSAITSVEHSASLQMHSLNFCEVVGSNSGAVWEETAANRERSEAACVGGIGENVRRQDLRHCVRRSTRLPLLVLKTPSPTRVPTPALAVAMDAGVTIFCLCHRAPKVREHRVLNTERNWRLLHSRASGTGPQTLLRRLRTALARVVHQYKPTSQANANGKSWPPVRS